MFSREVYYGGQAHTALKVAVQLRLGHGAYLVGSFVHTLPGRYFMRNASTYLP